MRPDSERKMPGEDSTISFGAPDDQLARPHADWAKRVRLFPLFAGISLNDRVQIISAAHQRHFSQGQAICIEGDSQRRVVLLMSGSTKMIRYGLDGSAVILRLCGPGELVDTLGLSLQGRCRSTSMAVTSCSSLVWGSGIFETLMSRYPLLRFNVTQILTKQLEDMEDRFREISTEPVAPRLGRQILRSVENVGILSKGSVEIRITREELGQLVGATLFTVSRLVSEWDRQEIVTTWREGFSVNNLKALTQMVDSCEQMESICN